MKKQNIENGFTPFLQKEDYDRMSLVELGRYICMKRKEILSQHKGTITVLKNGKYAGWHQTFVYCPKDGKRKILRGKTLDELEDKLVSFYTGGMARNKHTVQMCFDEWIEYLRVNKKASTIHAYEKVYKRNFGDISEKYIEDLSVIDIKMFVKNEVSNKKLTAKAYASLKTNLLGIFHYAKDKYGVDVGIDGVVTDLTRELRGTFERSKKSQKKDTDFIFIDEEVEKISEYCLKSGTLVDLGILLLFFCGLRIGELSALKKCDISDDFKVINVSRTEERIGSGADYIVVDSTKTESGCRSVLLTERASSLLEQIYNGSNPNEEYLFSDEQLGRYPAKKFRDRLYRLCIILNLPKRGPHAIRRTYASRLFEKRVPENLIIRHMGHIDFYITKSYYIYNRKNQDQLISELERAL